MKPWSCGSPAGLPSVNCALNEKRSCRKKSTDHFRSRTGRLTKSFAVRVAITVASISGFWSVDRGGRRKSSVGAGHLRRRRAGRLELGPHLEGRALDDAHDEGAEAIVGLRRLADDAADDWHVAGLDAAA